MLQLLKLFQYLQEVNLSPADTLALMRRIETHRCSAEDYEVLIKMVRAHIEMSADCLPKPPLRERSSPQRQAKRHRQAAKASRRRRR